MDPDPDCPTAALADRQVVAGYDDVGGALRLAASSDVVTYELEHVAVAVVDALDGVVPVRPGSAAAARDPGPHRRAPLRGGGRAPRSRPGARSGRRTTCARPPTSSGCRCGSRPPPAATTAGARSASAAAADVDGALERLGRPPGDALLAEAEMAFDVEVSIIVARGVDGRVSDLPAGAQHPRRGHPGRVRGAGTGPRRGRRACRRPRGAAGRRDGHGRDAHRRAVPDAATASSSSTSSRRASTTAATGRSKAPRRRSSSSTSGRSAGCELGSTAALAPTRDGQPARHGPAARRAPRGRRASARRWPIRPSTSTSTTSAGSSNVARWGT